MNNKSILFVSAQDFKEKSIQVIRKTPEAYQNAGWNVHYIVARDNSKNGNYFYESEVNPEGVEIQRFYMPLTALRDRIKNQTIQKIFSKISAYLCILKLAWHSHRLLNKNSFDIIYGYEIHGVLAIALIRLFKRLQNTKIITRFQGTWYYHFLKNRDIKRLILNWESYIALRTKSDICIMTNDGTSGDRVIKILNPENLKNLRFWLNGVDDQRITHNELKKFKISLGIPADFYVALSICRLEEWKRIDRSILIIKKIINEYNFNKLIYLIVGDGGQREFLEKLVDEYNLRNNIIFIGAIPNNDVKKFFSVTDIFLSTNDLTNVGNPLLEAIRANKIIFTLNIGDTSSWIKHSINGFIYDIDDMMIDQMANDILTVLNDPSIQKRITKNIKKTEDEKLWTWDERFKAEIDEVEKLLQKG